ncbi:hypothetical protein [Synechococcus sp. CBW1107]|uniref:hypothetical protein n=1 Tax=Synechococcus sp. CBW1107 TaxID=2789857 RepID=UPI002AD4FE67|nr:hypothetical protein [Synechococcus sp. CBW1107]
MPIPLSSASQARPARAMGLWQPARMRQLAGLILATALPLGGPAALKAQDLVGCQLIEGALQCVPGVTGTPQQQIRILRGEIGADQQLEGAVEQQIDGLRRLELQGEARVGSLLQATIVADGQAALAASQYHWYRLAPGRNHWELIAEASGPSYQPTTNDLAYEVMVVVVSETPNGTRRLASAPVGPIGVARPSITP